MDEKTWISIIQNIQNLKKSHHTFVPNVDISIPKVIHVKPLNENPTQVQVMAYHMDLYLSWRENKARLKTEARERAMRKAYYKKRRENHED